MIINLCGFEWKENYVLTYFGPLLSLIVFPDCLRSQPWLVQSGFQSGPETAPLAAVSARYCQSVSHFTAKSDTQLDMFKKSLLLNVSHFA